MLRCPARLAVALTALLLDAPARAGYVTIGSGCCSKWDDPTHGTPAVVTWGFMPDGTTIDSGFYLAAETSGPSNVTQLRTQIDGSYGAGAFDAALARAMDTWHRVAGISFVGPVADPGLPMASAGATTPDIRIGAFPASSVGFFQYLGAVGFGPPGNDLLFPDPLAGDVAFNLTSVFEILPGVEGDPWTSFASDLENLMLHELGHAAMGLRHPVQGPPEVMFVDPGCFAPTSAREDPKCQNGIDDDGMPGTDFDAGVSVLGPGGADPNGPDPQCVGKPHRNREAPDSCGLGAELVLAAALLARRRR